MKNGIRFLSGFFWVALMISEAHGASLKGVEMPDQASVAGKTLVLNGMGIRQATIFKVNVYIAALYVEKKSQDAVEILASPGPKKVEMVFVRDVDADSIKDAWKEALKKSCSAACAELEPSVAKLVSWMPEMKKGDSMTYLILADKMEAFHNGKKLGEISGKEFGAAVLKNWIGDHPPNEGLKKGMLGQ